MHIDPVSPALRAGSPVTAVFRRCGNNHVIPGIVASDCGALAATVQIMALANGGGSVLMMVPRRSVERFIIKPTVETEH